jgi:predicted phage terminase large subunit-like protein
MLACEDYPTLVDRQISKVRTEFPNWLGEVKTTKIDGFAFHLHPQYGGGKMCFRSLDAAKKYRGSEWAAILIDELTMHEEFVEAEVRFFDVLDGSLRWPGIENSFFAATSNPDGPGQIWVREFFIEKKLPGRRATQTDKFCYLEGVREKHDFLPQAYWDALESVGENLHKAWVDGDWYVEFGGYIFRRSWFEVVEALPVDILKLVRYWDKAGTDGGGKYTAGVLVAKSRENLFYICDLVHGQWSAGDREKVIKQTAELDRQRWGNRISVYHEQEPGSGGKESAEATTRMLSGFNVYADKVTGDKNTRLQPLAAQAQAGNVKMVAAKWNVDFLDEISIVPHSAVRDISDAAAGAFNKLTSSGGIGIYV